VGQWVKPSGSIAPIEVAGALPGEQGIVELKRTVRKPYKGRLIQVTSPSPDRVAPRCAHAALCGGCTWQQLDYQAQLREKMERVKSAFSGAEIDPILPCDDPYEYRNKMEFSFSQNRGGARFLGLMIAQAEPYVFNVERCHLAPAWFSEALRAVRAWWEASGLAAYHPPSDAGSLRFLTLREGARTGEKMAILNVSGRPEFALSRAQLDAFVAAVEGAAGVGISLFCRIHQACRGKPTQFFELHLAGPEAIFEELQLPAGALRFKISPASFFQPNTRQAERLYQTALSALRSPCRLLLDLYCGTGTLALAASPFAERVVGIELSPEATLDAEANRALNGIGNVEFHQGDVGTLLSRLALDSPDAVIVDPPRAGLDPLALSHLQRLAPKQILYISCNPLTQAANVAELVASGYRLARPLQPVDQFPHTPHIENIAILERIGHPIRKND
jgi:23S rRNA (uracil1939-C5)-methyltransferase